MSQNYQTTKMEDDLAFFWENKSTLSSTNIDPLNPARVLEGYKSKKVMITCDYQGQDVGLWDGNWCL